MSAEELEQYQKKVKKFLKKDKLEGALRLLKEQHPADIADIVKGLSLEQAKQVLDVLDDELMADVIAELDEEDREEILSDLSSKEIAEEVIENLDTDDAADLIAELPDEKQIEVIEAIEDQEHAQEIKDLLTYPEDSAGGLMGKELVKVNVNWTVHECTIELRKQAEEVEHVHTVYAVDDDNKLVGRVSLKKVILATPQTKIQDLISEEVRSVNVTEEATEAARIMDKYDFVVLPVVDEQGKLQGRITIDDVVDLIVDEAEKDYQMASGISDDVESTDNIWTLTKARFPWLLIGMAGGVAGAKVIGVFDDVINKEPILAAFIPLIAAMGGNVGVQSSAIIVQGAANGSLKGSTFGKLVKELGVGLVNGLLCSVILLGFNMVTGSDMMLSYTVSLSLFSVIIFAAVFGTWIPLVLHKYKVDPALATGPFITTANDIIGIFLYFYISQAFLS